MVFGISSTTERKLPRDCRVCGSIVSMQALVAAPVAIDACNQSGNRELVPSQVFEALFIGRCTPNKRERSRRKGTNLSQGCDGDGANGGKTDTLVDLVGVLGRWGRREGKLQMLAALRHSVLWTHAELASSLRRL